MRATPVIAATLLLLAAPANARKPKPVALPTVPPCAGTVESSPYFGCANADNLRAMVADPNDLNQGRDSRGSDAALEAAAIIRLRTDKVKPLRSNGTLERPASSSGQ